MATSARAAASRSAASTPCMSSGFFRPQILHEYIFITSALAPMPRLAAAQLEEARAHLAPASAPA